MIQHSIAEISEHALEGITESFTLLPFLFLTYLLMEALEHKASERSTHLVKQAGKLGPLFGSLTGIFPQCGFSAAASSLYAGRVITVGTLISIFLATSDEMLPILISENVPLMTIVKILGVKVLIGMISGFLIDFLFTRLLHKHTHDMDIHAFCEQEDCDSESSILVSALMHTLKIFVFILLISVVLEVLVCGLGQDVLASLFTSIPVLGQLIAGLVGLIPNCAASVVITQLYLEGIITPGMMMSGLLVGAGVGVLVLFRVNRKHTKENLSIAAVLYLTGVLWGILIDLLGIVF